MKNPNLVQIQKRNKRGIMSKYWVNPNSDKTIYEIENKIATLVSQDPNSQDHITQVNTLIKNSKQSNVNKIRLFKKVEANSGDTLIADSSGSRIISNAQKSGIEKTINESTVKNVPLALISAEASGQIRKEFDKDQLLELANSIKTVGLVSPIVVRPDKEKPGHYKIIAGERRFRALQLLSKESDEPMKVSIIVKDLNDADKDILQAVENLVRANNTPMEISDHFAKLINNHKMSIQDVSKQTSTSIEQVKNYMKLQNLTPDIRKMFEKGEIPKLVAYALGRTENASIQRRALGMILSKNLPSSQANSLMTSILDQPEFFTENESLSKEQIVAKRELDKQNISEASAEATFNRLIGKQREFIDKFVEDGSMKLSTLGLVASGKVNGAINEMESVIRDMELIVQRMKKERAKLNEADNSLFKSIRFKQMDRLYNSILEDVNILYKARMGLVPKKVTVQSKNGAYQKTVWVKTGETTPNKKPVAIKNILSYRSVIPEQGKWIDKAVGIEDTYDKNFKDGKPSNERKALHDSIIDKLFEGIKKPKNGEKEAVFLMGAPASGKSTIVKSLKIDDNEYVLSDADLVKSMIPEYNEGVKQRARNSAMLVHEESSYVVKQVRDKAVEEGYNIIVDGTGANYDKYAKVMKEMKDKGYKVTLIYANSDVETGIQRANARAEKTGRFIPEDFLRDAYAKIPGNFKKLYKESDNVYAFDTRYKGDNDAPLMFFHKESTNETIIDKKIFSEL